VKIQKYNNSDTIISVTVITIRCTTTLL